LIRYCTTEIATATEGMSEARTGNGRARDRRDAQVALRRAQLVCDILRLATQDKKGPRGCSVEASRRYTCCVRERSVLGVIFYPKKNPRRSFAAS
jgi:hypothetical protein